MGVAEVDLSSLTACEAVELLRDGAISSEALVEACLDRIVAFDGEVGAFVHVDPRHALDQARRADAERRAGHGVGVLNGVPVALKDIIDTADMPTAYGARPFEGRQPEADAAVVAALRAAGAVILGKTATTELATMTPSATRNPVNLDHTPGGSSSGSAAAVAADMVPVALGTQTAGSVIRPASYCGVYGFKPTFGLVPRSGVLIQSHTLDTIGVFARSIEDLALAVDVMQAYDPADRGSLSVPRPRLHATATTDWSVPPTFAVIKPPGFEDAPAVLREAFGELVEELGSRAIELDLVAACGRALEAARLIHKVELAAHYGPVVDACRDTLATKLAEEVEAGRRISAVDYATALEAREVIYRGLTEIFTEYGTILTPSATGPAPRGLESTGDPVFNSVWGYLGMPALSMPLLEGDGLPMGVQLVGARRDDGRLLRTGLAMLRQLSAEA